MKDRPAQGADMDEKTSDRISVLLIDDERDYSDTMGFYLKAKGFKVRCADSGRAGLEQIEAEPPEIVFLDFLMPVMNGVETLRCIRKIAPDLPVVMVTSYAGAEQMEEARSIGIEDIFAKSEDFSVAARMVRHALSRAVAKKAV